MFDEALLPDPTTPVIAHALLSSVAVVTGALQSILAYGETLGAGPRDDLLQVALTQAEYLAEVLRDMARGLPADVIDALDAISDRRPVGGG